MARSIDDILRDARSRLNRVQPEEVGAILRDGGLLIDIRPHAQRVLEGEIPNATIIERNVLEWRFDLLGDFHIKSVTNHDQPVIVICSEGYTSSLAAAALQELGFTNATDVVGGFRAWQEFGLPTQPGGTPAIP